MKEDTTNLDGSLEFEEIRLTEKDLLGGGTEMFDLVLRQLHLLRRLPLFGPQ